MAVYKGTVLGKHLRDSQGRLLNKDGSLYKITPNRGYFKKGKRYSPDTEFKKGIIPHNKGLKITEYVPPHSLEKLKRTQFKPGQLPHTAKEKGYISRLERVRANGNIEVVYNINIDWKGNRKPHNSYKWYLWEVEHQTDRPEGMIITVKNGNQDDMRLDNFEVISRAENLFRNRGWKR